MARQWSGGLALIPLTAPSDPLTSLFKPVQPPTAFEQTVERLATAIKLGFLPPGGQLPPERELARQLEISRTTLRQALTALTQSGLVTTSRGRRGGTFVADPLPLPPRPRLPLRPSGGRGQLAPGGVDVLARRAVTATRPTRCR